MSSPGTGTIIPMTERERFHAALLDIHAKAGFPSIVTVERLSRGKVSKSSVHLLLGDLTRKPRWTTVESVVIALNGDVEMMRDLYRQAHDTSYTSTYDDAPQIMRSPKPRLLARIDQLEAKVDALIELVRALSPVAAHHSHDTDTDAKAGKNQNGENH